MYDGDSFFTLGTGGQIGLVLLSLALWIGMIVITHRVTAMIRWRVWAVFSALTLFWLFVWLSPQVYYAYYLLIFDGLPVQIVVGWPPPGGADLTDIIIFRGADTLSAHAKGALFWLMALTAFLAGIPPDDDGHDDRPDRPSGQQQ